MKSVVFVVASLAVAAFSAIPGDEVTSLPLVDFKFPSKQYSGYLNFTDAMGTKHYHYWLVESESDPSTDPLVLWFNGGPGCSSLGGYFTEMGPIHFETPLGTPMPYLNPHRWNKKTNMLYIERYAEPAGTGYSYADSAEGYNYNDTVAAEDNALALLEFLKHYPEYKGRDLYITGESYAGIYVPTLAYNLLQRKKRGAATGVNLKGILVGNGCIGTEVGGCSQKESADIDWEFIGGHALVNASAYDAVRAECGDFSHPTNKCEALASAVMNNIGPVNIYDIYAECLSLESDASSNAARDPMWFAPPNFLERALGQPPAACFNSKDTTTEYLNRKDVREAIHVAPESVTGRWNLCGGPLHYTPTEPDLTQHVYPELIKNIRVHIYNGDTDLCVPYVGNERWTTRVGRIFGLVEGWRPWTVDRQVAGYVTSYKEGFKFSTVKGAGHMVPQFQPAFAEAMFTRFVNDEPM